MPLVISLRIWLAAGVADEMLVQVSYAIGVAKPMNIFVNTFGRAKVNMTDGEIAAKIWDIFDMRPKAIEERLKLRNPIYFETASYGHMGQQTPDGDEDILFPLFQKPVLVMWSYSHGRNWIMQIRSRTCLVYKK